MFFIAFVIKYGTWSSPQAELRPGAPHKKNCDLDHTNTNANINTTRIKPTSALLEVRPATP